VTSAGEADSYVWTSRPSAAGAGAGGATLWLVPANAAGLTVRTPFDGLGLRGNASSQVLASEVVVPPGARLGDDGAGLDIALTVALPTFQILNSSCSLGLMDAAIAMTIAHATHRAFRTPRPIVGRADATLRMLQSKAVAGEAALDVLDAAMRVGGGAAFRKDIGVERFFRDARASAVMAPTVDALQEFIGRVVCGMALFG
jgi:alkylation response protein AidB-like acyl-CoA dehydrogenase